MLGVRWGSLVRGSGSVCIGGCDRCLLSRSMDHYSGSELGGACVHLISRLARVDRRAVGSRVLWSRLSISSVIVLSVESVLLN